VSKLTCSPLCRCAQGCQERIGSAREKDPIWSLLCIDLQEVMEGSEILHGEQLLDGRYGVLQERCVDVVRNKYIVSYPQRKTNSEVSNLASTKPQ
jgi:hypothetical protein